jgi:AcrR family transcriptional regulator
MFSDGKEVRRMVSDTRGAIRDVAFELFAKHGYEKTSLREVLLDAANAVLRLGNHLRP